MWIADVLVIVTSVCGSALALFLIKEEWRMWGETRQQTRELSPEVRRRHRRTAVLTLGGMVIAAGLIWGAYEWGSHAWSTKSGAALAIAAFVLVMGGALAAMVLQSVREMRP